MRLITIILGFVLAGPAMAADWMEYAYPDFSFTVHFPAAPKIESTSYQGPDGLALEARVYLVTQDTGSFRLTIADVPDGVANENTLVTHAVNSTTQGGAIKLDIAHRIRSTYGRQLAVAGANGGYAYVSVFYYKKRLYQLEGRALAAGGQAEVDAMIFQQSLDLTAD
jgi:hypothetical protein